MVVNCTFVLDVDDEAKGAGCNNGLLAFSQNNNNLFMGNLMLSNAGYSMGAGANYTGTTTKKATTAGFNVYSEAPKIVLTDEGNGTDMTGIRTADVVSSNELSADGLLHWDGPAAKLSGYTPASPAQVEAVIKAYPVDGEEFYKWLTDKGVFGGSSSLLVQCYPVFACIILIMRSRFAALPYMDLFNAFSLLFIPSIGPFVRS
jgi:hypothetical protein